MLVHVGAVLATCFLGPLATLAQQDYIVWASVIFSRTGERTPEVLGDIPTTLTSLGAQQMYTSGAFFRERYITSVSSNDGMYTAPLEGLSADSIDPLQLYVMTLDEQWTIASAQAFIQGLYPPYTLNSSVATLLDPTSMLANGTYVEYPLSGYQYAQIHTAGGTDEQFPFLGGSLDCPSFDEAAIVAAYSPEQQATAESSKSVYEAVGEPLLASVLVPAAWDYYNAYAIYDYLNYENAHNATVQALLSEPQYIQPGTNVSYLSQLRWYADQQQYAQLGNLTQYNNYTGGGTTELVSGVQGSISTIAGNFLAAKILEQLQIAIETQGEVYKLSVLVGDYDPMVSFFALTGLPNLDSNFYGLPDFASVLVFELFSYTNNSVNLAFPDTSDLWVRFYFRNGTNGSNDASGNYQSYPLFNTGPSQTDLPWETFQTSMYDIVVGDIGTWCTACGAQNIFCAAWNSSDAATGTDDCLTLQASRNQMKPAVAGVVGAVVTLAIAGLIFGSLMLFGGVRLYRVPRSRKNSELGGFKGSQKLASDRDLTIPKGGAVIGASVERSGLESPTSPAGGHERVGSWELKQADKDYGLNIADAQSTRRASLDEEEPEESVDPFRDPVKAKETV